MRILMLSNYFPPFEKGGYEQLCRDVALRLHQRGHEVEIITSNFGRASADQLEIVVHRQLPLSPDYNSRLNLAIQFVIKRRQDEQSARQCLRRIADKFEPDIVFIWNLQSVPRVLATEAEALPNSAVAYWLAGYSPTEADEFWEYWSSPGNSFLGNLLRRFFSGIALRQMHDEGKPLQLAMQNTAVVSEFMRTKGRQEGTVPPDTAVIYNGIELETFYHSTRSVTGPLKMLQAGRLSYNKGAHVSIKALSKIVNEYGIRQVRLTFAGSGEAADQARLAALVKHHKLEEYINFLGWLPRERMAGTIHEHDVLLLPTIQQEAFARVVLEAMAGGLAVIAADTGGTSEIVQHDKTGLLCPPGDEIMLAEQILRLVQNTHLRRELALQGQERVVEQFSLDYMVDNLEQFLTRAVCEKRIA